MTTPPTLIDRIYAMTFAKKRLSYWQPALRTELQRARRFVLDDRMSGFVADLAFAAFSPKSGRCKRAMIEQWRRSARLPHALTWIEFNAPAERARFRELTKTFPRRVGAVDLYPELVSPIHESSPFANTREGWLLRQHPQLETAFMATVFIDISPAARREGLPLGAWGFNGSYVWTTDDSQSPWPGRHDRSDLRDLSQHHLRYLRSPITLSQVALGIAGYDESRASIAEAADIIRTPNASSREAAAQAFVAYAGVLRRIWSVLATINDIPIVARTVVPAKGFVGAGSYRRFLERKMITLRVPTERDLHKLARQAVAAARRRAHTVRGHWRDYFRHPGERIWIKEHQRGDASLGFVTHDYRVAHEDEHR